MRHCLPASALPMVLFAMTLAPGCSGGSSDESRFKSFLSDYGFFRGALADLQPADGVIPYDVAAPLYSDHASKARFVALPAGGRIAFDASERWGFPDGTSLIKAFYYPNDARNPAAGKRIIETRVIQKSGGQWYPITYLWDQTQMDARRFVAGTELDLSYVDAAGATQALHYVVPNTSQCKECHLQDMALSPIGPRTEELNKAFAYATGSENQLTHLDKLGLLDTSAAGGTLPAVDKLPVLTNPYDDQAALEPRARAWLDANCAHCHSERGYASSTKLRLEVETTSPVDLGVCRPPVAAGPGAGGFLWDVVPGDPDHSIMMYRLTMVTDPKAKMPPIPLTTVDTAGVALVRQWIAAMPAGTCK